MSQNKLDSKQQHTFLAIDLKSFYASSECADRRLDPLTTNLVVADLSRTEKTICLAVSPSLKAYGISGRARLFEVVQRVAQVNAERLRAYRCRLRQQRQSGTGAAPNYREADFTGESFDALALASDPSLRLSYIVAPPRMARYEEVSSSIVGIYLKYIDFSDILVYSIDEVFIDATNYLDYYHMTAHELAMTMVREVLYTTGITATAGIGSNLYLAKAAMDIVAKHAAIDRDGVRIAELNEDSYREKLWLHRPLTDFWRVGKGYARKLEANGMFTMGDVARCSVGHNPKTGKPSSYYTEDLLFRLFGVNAETLIDHAWGYEPCTIADAKAVNAKRKSLSQGQVLKKPYNYVKTELIVKEMTDLLVLDLVEKGLMTNQIVLTIGYDRESLIQKDSSGRYYYSATGKLYTGKVVRDAYGRPHPYHAQGTANLKEYSPAADGYNGAAGSYGDTVEGYTSSTEIIMAATLKLFDKIADKDLLSRRINIVAARVKPAAEIRKAAADEKYEQLDLFTDYAALERQRKAEEEKREKEHRLQLAVIKLRKRYGKNAVLKGMNLEKDGTTIERNGQIGGHRAE